MAMSSHHAGVTMEDYLQFCRDHPNERYEYIDGQIVMLAGGKINHSRIATNINAMLANTLKANCEAFTSDAVFKLPSGQGLLPDVAVSCDERDHANNDYIEHPCVIFEVLSPSTEAIDRGKKFTFYRGCPSIMEYVLVNSDTLLVEVFRREKDPMWTYFVYGVDDIVMLSTIGVSLSVKQMYKNVVF